MNEIYLKDDGQLISKDVPVKTQPLMYLSYKIGLEENCTLRSFFQMLEKYPLLAQLNPFLPMYIDQYRLAPKNGCQYEGIDHIALTKTIEMIGFPGDPSIEIYMSFRGVCGNEIREIREVWLENLLDMGIKLGQLKHIIFGDSMDTFEFETVFSLFEFIDGISWELSFHNMPVECKISL
jgi:hypothetical protein